LIVRADDPFDAVTGAVDVAKAGTIVAFVATADTAVPVSTDVIAIFNASAASMLLSAGTGSATGAVAAVPPVAADPATVRVVVAAFAAGDTSIVLVRAAAMISDTFLNEFI
jgi:hypothetical protein